MNKALTKYVGLIMAHGKKPELKRLLLQRKQIKRWRYGGIG